MRLLARALVLMAGTLAFAQNLPPEKWKEDLDFLTRQLPARHKNLFYRLRQEDFAAQAAKIAADLPHMNEAEIRTALVRLVASAGNAHTSINALSRTPWYPMRLVQFPDGFYVVEAAPEYRDAIGARLVSIGDTAAAVVAARLRPLVPMETPQCEKTYIPGLLRSAAALQATKVLPDMAAGAFRFEKDGRTFQVRVRAVEGGASPILEGFPYSAPLYLSDLKSAYWFRYLPSDRTLYIQYNRCENVKTRPFADFANEAMQAAASNPVDKLVVDLRHNGGGNSQVIDPLIAALKRRPHLTRKGRFFVLIGRDTFSSGFIAAWQLRKQFRARLVGEVSAQRPNGYGDVGVFELPNSGLRVRYCTKYFRFVKGDPDALPVDVPVELTARDYFAGRDPVLEKVLGR
ncbi:MAG: hypothetical protein LAP87_07210 [Acidobacteriia bacterium]|nr:hypothetical protein [Terriglobia bacterium]